MGKRFPLFNQSLALANYKPRRSEALATLQQAREIFADLQLGHMVAKCDEIIRHFNQTSHRRRAKLLLWFCVGVAIFLLIAWLRAK